MRRDEGEGLQPQRQHITTDIVPFKRMDNTSLTVSADRD